MRRGHVTHLGIARMSHRDSGSRRRDRDPPAERFDSRGVIKSSSSPRRTLPPLRTGLFRPLARSAASEIRVFWVACRLSCECDQPAGGQSPSLVVREQLPSTARNYDDHVHDSPSARSACRLILHPSSPVNSHPEENDE